MSERKKIYELLKKGFLSVPEIRRILKIKKEINIYKELYHISRSAKAKGEKLVVIPFKCKKCGFIFSSLFNKPSKCPKCKSKWIEEAKYKIES